MTNEEYIEKMVQITSGFSKEGYQVILASFCREEGDLDAVQEIKNRIRTSRRILPYLITMEQIVINY
mgnify:CR=1 FL=1